ncbi:MAG: ATP-binding protein [Bryobacteraceae bacterium]
MIKSFRLQLTAWYLLFFTAVFVLFSVFLYGLLSKALYERLDDKLDSEENTAIGFFKEELAEAHGDALVAARETISEMHVRSLLLAIFEGNRLLASSAPVERRELLDLASQSAQRGQPGLLTVAPLSGGSEARCMAHPFSVNAHPFVLLAAESVDPVADDLKLVRRVLVLTLPVIVLIAGAGAFLLATRSLAPMRRMAAQAKTITDRNLRMGIDAGGASEELRLLADSFNAVLARLDRSFATMRRFVADASHELRTPLAVIRGEADVALAVDRSGAEYKESIAIIQDEARRLSRLVDDLLNLARVDADEVRLEVEPFYLNDLLTECCRSVQPLASSKNVGLECRCREDVTFRGDQELLRRLILNLLDNAIRYTPAGGKVAAKLEANAGDLRIIVSDTGIGIPPDAAPHVFERFYRADEARSREQGGFGLGLSIVKWIAESHKGTVQLNSQPGVGSTFTVLLHN